MLFTFLYASEGGPIGFIWWALPTLLRVENVPVEEITGLLAVVTLIWTFKFVWAPFVDAMRTAGWGFRAWIASAQVMMGLTLIPLIQIDAMERFELFVALLLLHALSATIQDVAIDALAIRYVPRPERGFINGWMQAGMLIGRSIFGGGALLVADKFGWNWIFAGLILVVWSSLALLLFVREEERDPAKREACGGG